MATDRQIDYATKKWEYTPGIGDNGATLRNILEVPLAPIPDELIINLQATIYHRFKGNSPHQRGARADLYAALGISDGTHDHPAIEKARTEAVARQLTLIADGDAGE